MRICKNYSKVVYNITDIKFLRDVNALLKSYIIDVVIYKKFVCRVNVFVHLEDKSGWLDASIIRDVAETLLETTVNDIMNHFEKVKLKF